MNNNTITVGDVVSVSSKLPRIYERFGSMIAPHYECMVVEIDEGMALLDSIPAKHIFLFPLKYLIKVNAEPKNEPKIKVGDFVIVKQDMELTKLFSVFKREVSVVTKIENGKVKLEIDRLGYNDLELVDVPLDCIQKVDAIEYPYNHSEHKIICDSIPEPTFTMLWDYYTAQLAHDIAVKLVNKNTTDFAEVGANAVKVAKAVVEGLKRK